MPVPHAVRCRDTAAPWLFRNILEAIRLLVYAVMPSSTVGSEMAVGRSGMGCDEADKTLRVAAMGGYTRCCF